MIESLDPAAAELEPPAGPPAELPGPSPAERPGPSPVELALAQLVDDSKRYHERAAHREDVIDRMHTELEQLRRGERRNLLRPLLGEVCRLRDDLLRQAGALPADFDGPRARALLQSYADSMEQALADNGVVTYAPQPHEEFEPRGQRAVERTPSPDPQLVGRIAGVRKCGYRDLETDLPIAPAEVVVYVPAPTATEGVMP